jgi:hypothetical protein
MRVLDLIRQGRHASQPHASRAGPTGGQRSEIPPDFFPDTLTSRVLQTSPIPSAMLLKTISNMAPASTS